jgi:hypothetical protein
MPSLPVGCSKTVNNTNVVQQNVFQCHEHNTEDVEKIPTSLKGNYGKIFLLKEKSEIHNEELHESYSSPGPKRMMQVMNEEGMAHGMNGREEKCIESSGRIS